MSLDVNGAPLGLGETAEQQLHAVWETLDDVMVEVMKEGFFPMERPQYAPPALDPTWLDNLTPEKYHLLTAQLSAWKSYAQSIMTTLDCGIAECDNELDQLAASIRENARKAPGKKPSVEAIKDLVKVNPRITELTQRKQMLQQKKKLVEPHFDRYGRDLRILSRALEMRGQELGSVGKGDARGPRRDF